MASNCPQAWRVYILNKGRKIRKETKASEETPDDGMFPLYIMPFKSDGMSVMEILFFLPEGFSFTCPSLAGAMQGDEYILENVSNSPQLYYGEVSWLGSSSRERILLAAACCWEEREIHEETRDITADKGKSVDVEIPLWVDTLENKLWMLHYVQENGWRLTVMTFLNELDAKISRICLI